MTVKTQPPAPSQTRRKRSRVIGALAVLMTLLAAACSSGFDTDTAETAVSPAVDSGGYASDAIDDAGGDDDEEGNFFDEVAESEPAERIRGEAEGDAQALSTLTITGASGTEAVAQIPDIGRDIIYTATLDIASTDVSRATREAIRAIEARGGFLFSQETQGGVYGSSVLTFKVIPDQFHAALNDLGSVGTIRSQSISADDVSAVVVDLESRINTAEASVERLRNLLEDARELNTIATLENQLLQRETTLEQLRGQLRSVRNQVDLATITVFVSELTNRPSMTLEAVSYAGHDAGFGCFDSPNTRSGEVGDPITICYRLTNTGDTPLVDLTLDDPSLGATVDTLVVVDGSATELSPGDSVLLAQEIELVEPVRVRTTATAVGLDADGNEIADDVRATAPTMRFDVTDFEDGFPSFGEVLGNSWDALKTIAIVIALIAVAIAPFALVAAVVVGPMWMWLRRNRHARTERPPMPTPPAPTEEPHADAETTEPAATTA